MLSADGFTEYNLKSFNSMSCLNTYYLLKCIKIAFQPTILLEFWTTKLSECIIKSSS